MSDQNLSTGDKFAAAEEQALSEMDLSTATPDVEPVEASDDDEAQDDDGTADDVDDETIADDPAAPGTDDATPFDPAQWDGKMESLPENLRPAVTAIHKTMERGMHMKFQELATLRKEYEQKLEALRSTPTPSPVGETPPPPPTNDQSYEEQVAAQDKRDAYFARKALEEHAKTMPQFQQVEVIAKQQEAAARVSLIQQQEGFTPEIGAAMQMIAEQHPAYARMLDTDETALVLFQTAKLAVENNALRLSKDEKQQALALKAAAGIKKKAASAKQAIDRPANTRSSSPVETYARTFEAAEAAALRDFESSRK